jgi:putative ABC transport system permease protein
MIALILRSSFRLLARNKLSSIVKVLGFAVGTAFFLLTVKFVHYEITFDKQHPHSGRIYRYVHRSNAPEGMQRFAFTSAMTGPALKDRYPEVLSFSRILISRVSLRNPLSDATFNEKKFAFTDESFFDLFNFPLRGDARGAQLLKEPLSLILTPSSSRKYFGDADPVGKTLILNGELEFVVKGIFKRDIEQSHLNFDFIASFASLTTIANHPKVSRQIPASLNLEQKGFNTFYTYLLLSSASAAEGLIAKFPAFIEAFRGPGRSERLKPTLQSLESIHLSSDLLYEIDQNGSLKTVYAFMVIGFLTLFIACINYVNTATAEFLKRARGIGLKKILGIRRSSLLIGHLSETSILAIISLAIGYLLGLLLSPVFNNIVSRNIDLKNVDALYVLMFIFLIIIVASGIYPSVKISQTNPLHAFKGTLSADRSGFTMRNMLVSFQLLISFCLVSISLLIYSQLHHIDSQNLGFVPEQVVVVDATTIDPQQRLVFKNALMNDPTFRHVGMCSTPPGEALFTYGLSFPEHGMDDDRRIVFYQSFVDADYQNALGLKITRGRFFSLESPADSDAYVVVNHAALKVLNDSMLTTTFKYKDAFRNQDMNKGIAGVINDFNFESLHQDINPLMLEYNPLRSGYLLVRFEARQAQNVIASLQERWNETFSSDPFDYYFLDERFRSLYAQEQSQKKLITTVASVAIFLAALGIFGTTTFMVEQKTKEVSIRKILGSTRSELLVLLVKPSLSLTAVAGILGVPIALFFGNEWLAQFPYRVSFSPALFFIAFASIVVVVLATILYQCFRLTMINPTEVLRKIF